MRSIVELITDLKDSTVKLCDYYKARADELDKDARVARDMVREQQDILDDCERALLHLRN